jgi:hypothetical protein
MNDETVAGSTKRPKTTRRVVTAAAAATGALARWPVSVPARRRVGESPEETRFLANAFIQRTTDHSASVRVAAAVPVRVELCISLAGGGADRCERRITGTKTRRNHIIPVRGLLPDATYDYRVTTTVPDPEPGAERPSKTPGVIKASALRSAPADPDGAAIDIEAGPQVVALATVAGARWSTSIYGNGRLDYEADPQAAAEFDPLSLEQQFELPRYVNRKLEDALTADHRVCLSPLQPETVYGYSVTSVAGVSPATSQRRRFSTLPLQGAQSGAFSPGRRFPLDLRADGIVAMANGGLLAWTRGGEAALLRLAAGKLSEDARWAPGGAIGGAAASTDGRILLSLPGPANGAGLPTAIIRAYAPDAASPSGYSPLADLGPLIGAPGALALDTSGNLAALTVTTGDDGIPESLFNLFDADATAPGGFTLRFAMQPFGQATAMAGTIGGSLLFLAAGRAIVALAGDIHNPDGAVTVWDGRNAGKGPWIETAAISAGPSGDLYLIDGCTGAIQTVSVDPASGVFAATAVGNTRDVPGGLEGTPIGLAVDRSGTALALERGAGGARTMALFRLSGATSTSAGSGVGQPLDARDWRPRER